MRIDLTSGAYAVLQLRNGNAPGHAVNIETDAKRHGPQREHPGHQGATYWYSLKADFGAGRADLNIYDVPGFNLVGSVSKNTKTGSRIEVHSHRQRRRSQIQRPYALQLLRGHAVRLDPCRVSAGAVTALDSGPADKSPNLRNVLMLTRSFSCLCLAVVFAVGPSSLRLRLPRSGGIIDPLRATDWSHPGVAGGIVNRTTICQTLNPGATAANINSAIAACNNGVVFLSAGTATCRRGSRSGPRAT